MRKSILIAALITILVGIGAIYWANIAAPAIILSYTEGSLVGFSLPPKAIQSESEKPFTAAPEQLAISKYTGQSLSYLGSDSLLSGQPKEFVEFQRQRLVDDLAILKDSPSDINALIDIGLVKKQVNNYTGARDVWEYVNIIYPDQALNHLNLANLYAAYLGDFEKAEDNYFKAVDLDSASPNPYLKLAEFYRDFYTTKYNLIDDVLLSGLETLPGEPNMTLMLALHYKSTANKSGAIEYFEKFLKLPGLNVAQIDAVKKELDQLRSL